MNRSQRYINLIKNGICFLQMQFRFRNSYFVLSSFIIIALLALQSCSGSKEIFQLDINKIKAMNKTQGAPNINIVEVSDRRAVPNSEVGYARVGMLAERAPLIIETPLKEFISDAFRKTLMKDTLPSKFVPVKISIETFWAYEPNSTFGKSSIFQYAFTFSYPQSTERIQRVTINGSTKFSSNGDAPNSLLIKYNIFFKSLSPFMERGIKGERQGIVIQG